MALDEFRLFGIVGCNSFGEEFIDFATFVARKLNGSKIPEEDRSSDPVVAWSGDEQVGHLGLFPSFSMLNHSCLPNAVNFVVAGRMMVFAAKRIPKGSEVLINYLGRGSLRPVDERQAHLAEGYHFSCDCPRCRAELLLRCTREAGADEGAASLVDAVQCILVRCEERVQLINTWDRPPQVGGTEAAVLAQRAEDGAGAPFLSGEACCQDAVMGTAVAGQPADLQREAMRLLLEQVAADVGRLEQLLEQVAAMGAAGDDAQAQWLRASAFDLYSQHVACAEMLGRREEAWGALRQQLALCEAVAPCSDLHMYLAVKALSLSRALWGPGSADARSALERCQALLRGRYGAQLSDSTVELLLQGAVHGLSQVQV